MVWTALARYYNPISLISVMMWTASARYYNPISLISVISQQRCWFCIVFPLNFQFYPPPPSNGSTRYPRWRRHQGGRRIPHTHTHTWNPDVPDVPGYPLQPGAAWPGHVRGETAAAREPCKTEVWKWIFHECENGYWIWKLDRVNYIVWIIIFIFLAKLRFENGYWRCGVGGMWWLAWALFLVCYQSTELIKDFFFVSYCFHFTSHRKKTSRPPTRRPKSAFVSTKKVRGGGVKEQECNQLIEREKNTNNPFCTKVVYMCIMCLYYVWCVCMYVCVYSDRDKSWPICYVISQGIGQDVSRSLYICMYGRELSVYM